jgi:hypothetical protein
MDGKRMLVNYVITLVPKSGAGARNCGNLNQERFRYQRMGKRKTAPEIHLVFNVN